MGLLGDWLGSKNMDDPVRGTAQVVGASGPPDDATSANCSLTLVVTAEGVPATPIQHSAMVRVDRWPYPGTTLPVTVDRANPERLRIEWDEVPASGDVAWERAQALAAGGGEGFAMGGMGGMQQITINAGGEIDDATRQQLAAMGVDVDALVQQAQALKQAHGGGEAQAAPEAGGDDLSEQLQRLAQRHEAGALDDAEFAAAKKRLLDG